jgi:acyl carrier protein
MIPSKIKEIILEYYKYEGEITADTRLSDFIPSSLEYLEFLFFIEERYNIDLGPEFMQDMETLGDLVNKMKKYHFGGLQSDLE